MGLLDKLWDDVLAGPQPDKGLKILRKERLAAGLSDVFQVDNDDFSQRMMDRRRSAEFQHAQSESRRVTQSISIKKPPMLRTLDTDSPMNSPGSYGSSPLLHLLWHRLLQACSGRKTEGGVACFTLTAGSCPEVAPLNSSMCPLPIHPQYMTGW